MSSMLEFWFWFWTSQKVKEAVEQRLSITTQCPREEYSISLPVGIPASVRRYYNTVIIPPGQVNQELYCVYIINLPGFKILFDTLKDRNISRVKAIVLFMLHNLSQ